MPAPAQYPDNEALCKFDCQMVTAVSQSEVFWVHPDNVIQIKVALLRHLELVSDDSVSSISNPQSATAEPSQSFAIYLDNAKKFNSIQTRSEPGQVRWVFSPGSPNSTHVLCSPVGGLRHFCLASLSSSQFDFIRRAQFDSLSKEIAAEQHQLSKLALTWVKRRKAVPIANAAFSRSRFRYIDPNPSSKCGDQTGADLFSTSPTSSMDVSDLWATLDTNIELSKAGTKSGDQDKTQFPYALLEVRYKGMDKPDWLTELETSHLVYQVDGFSLYAHSVALFYSNALSRLPSWMELVEEGVDIRKTPKRQAQTSLQSARTLPGLRTQPSLQNLQSTANERDQLLASTGAGYGMENQPVVRYWNEFDDPEDGPDNGVFVIIPDEDEEQHGLFSDKNVMQLLQFSDNFMEKVYKVKDKFSQMVGLKREQDDTDDDSIQEYRGLPTIYEEEEGYSSPDELEQYLDNRQGSDLSYYSSPSPVSKQRDFILCSLYLLLYLLSAVTIFFLSNIIIDNDLSQFSVLVVASIVSGLLLALAFCLFAMYLFFMLSEPPNIIHQIAVYLAFFGIVSLAIGEIVWIVL